MKKDDLRPYPYEDYDKGAEMSTNDEQFELWITQEDNQMDKRDAFTKGWLWGVLTMTIAVAVLVAVLI